jgi:hypothetical protein
MDIRNWKLATIITSLLIVSACSHDNANVQSAAPGSELTGPFERDAQATQDEAVPACGGIPCNRTTKKCCSGLWCCKNLGPTPRCFDPKKIQVCIWY